MGDFFQQLSSISKPGKEVDSTTVVNFYINKHDAFKLLYCHEFKSSVYMHVCTSTVNVRTLHFENIWSVNQVINFCLSPQNITCLPLMLWRIFHNYVERMRACFSRKRGKMSLNFAPKFKLFSSGFCRRLWLMQYFCEYPLWYRGLINNTHVF